MKRCSARPYEGSENYVFVSYCHKDKEYVYPIIEQLAKEGVRIWYDEGIDPGSEWPEIIANHLNNCYLCISFITKNSVESHNCRREINFALQKRKNFISVVLEEVELSLGMQMQLSATQAIYKYKLDTESEFFLKLYDAKELYKCKGNPHPEIDVSLPEEPDVQDIDNEIPDVQANVVKFCFFRINTSGRYVIKEGLNIIGRSKQCDCIIAGNAGISRKHAIIKCSDDVCFLIDNNSSNGTYLNSLLLEAGKEYELKDGDVFKLDNERFRFEKNL